MKNKLFTFFACSILTFSACKKDKTAPLKAYEDIVFSDIQMFESKFSNDIINITNDSGDPILKSGSVIFYKTNKGILGKFIIANISEQNLLTIDIINYDSNGNIILNKSGINIQPGNSCDLDQGIETTTNVLRNFDWEAAQAKQVIMPANSATFYVYSN